MLCPKAGKSHKPSFQHKFHLLALLMLLYTQTATAQEGNKTTTAEATTETAVNTRTTNTTPITNTTTTTTASAPIRIVGFVPHRYTSHNNITILHEVRVDEKAAPPLVLNTDEVLPQKPVKKKPYTLLDKTTLTEYEKPRPLKEYELHPVTFDFNLGDLEDLAHESFKKGDLSAEEQHLLRNGNDAGLTYTEHSIEGLDSGDATDSATATLGTTPSIAADTSTTSLSGMVTGSPHIFKILKNKNSKKGRELLKQDEAHKSASANVNSISRYFGAADGVAAENATAESLHAGNSFEMVTHLYDHFQWQAADIRTKVTTACGLEMQAYLTALHGNYEWAQRAYDASGHYRGQLFYGNDKWLGQKTFCYELNRQLDPEQRKHFEFEFYVARVAVRLWLPHKVQTELVVGECLPKSCAARDVQAILTLDPYAHVLGALNATNATTTTTYVHVHSVRSVPGIYSVWRDLNCQIFISLMLSLMLIVCLATCYQAQLHRRQLTTPIPAISAKIDARLAAAAHSSSGTYNGKAFELYQMRTLSDNNNVVEIEADLNGNGKALTQQQPQHTNGNGSAAAANSEAATSTADATDRAQMADYKLETGSSAGTAGTYEAKQQLGLPEQFLLCFAFQTNANSILNIDENKESQTSCVHGLRVFSVLWTIMVHTYLQMFTIGENRFQRIIVERSVWYQFVGNATFSVDTFFFISGFLVTLLYLKQEKKYPEDTGQFVRRSLWDTAMILIYRYIRLTPAYFFVIFFNDFALRQTTDGSVFTPNVDLGNCSPYWWRNILYINNFYPLSEICMLWSWYMSNDMQFYIMATVLLVLATRYFKTVVLIVFAFLLSSWGISGIISLHYHYTHKVANPFESFDFLYDKPWQRVGTYIIGMMAGYVIYKVRTPPMVSKRLNWLLWTCSLGLLCLIIFGVWDGELGVLTTAFYVSLGHSAYGLALVWIVLSCCWGLSPAVNRILSYRGLWPLSRLTYCTYLIHPVVMRIILFRMGGTVHLNNLFVMTIYLGNAVVSFGVAFFISILFEAPVIRLLKICFRK